MRLGDKFTINATKKQGLIDQEVSLFINNIKIALNTVAERGATLPVTLTNQGWNSSYASYADINLALVRFCREEGLDFEPYGVTDRYVNIKFFLPPVKGGVRKQF